MAKAKFNAKEFLLKRGEWLIVGIFGFICLMLLVWGTSSGSANPTPDITKIQGDAKRVHQGIGEQKVDPEQTKDFKPPEWLARPYKYDTPPASVFAQAKHPLFDPVAQPSTKRENPNVLTITDYQVDLTRSAMLGYDIILDNQGNASIAVLTTTTKSNIDEAKLKKAADDFKKAVDRKFGVQQVVKRPAPMQPMVPGMNPMAPGANPHGLNNGQFKQDSQRTEKSVKYVPLTEIEASVKTGNLPAFTVLPLRLVTVHAVVPYKKQLDEIKRALRLPNPSPTAKKEEHDRSDAEAKLWGPWYDGFEVQRKVSRIRPDGTPQVVEDWPDTKDPKDVSGNYPFEEFYIDKIDSKKIADHLDEGHIPYFLKPELMLAMPLPQLAKDLNVKYPEIKMKEIVDNIERLKKANQKEVTPSKLLEKLSGTKSKKSIYTPQTAENLEGLGIDAKPFGFTPPGKTAPMANNNPPVVARPAGALGTPKPPEGYEGNAKVTVEEGVDSFLLRFVDCNVEPGYAYEYRIRLRMVNPNFGQTDLVANPEFAKDSYKILYSKWADLGQPITVPAESYLYAHDVKSYRDQTNTTYPTSAPDPRDDVKTANNFLNRALQAKDDQVVVQVATWMEQVRAGDNTKREPIGGWVVAEMPVSRGEYVGRKQIVRLPLWSSESQQYVFREVTDKVVKGKFQPKGWMVDFSTLSVLVDFEGGKVKTKSSVKFDNNGNLVPGTRTFEEDVASEILIVRPDGKLVVRSSHQDDLDPTRKDILSKWTDWLKEVEKHKAPGTTSEPNPFDPKKN